MAIRVRADGTMLCAAMSEPLPGDTYIDDELHYKMSVIKRVLVTEDMEGHKRSGGRWWWKGSVPDRVSISFFYRSGGESE